MAQENKLFYIGRFNETLEDSQDGSMTKEAELFSVGTHRGVEYKDADLDALVDNFSADETVPLQIDHSESALHTVGFLEEVTKKDGKLFGKLEVIDEAVKERINKKLMGKLSISFYLKQTDEGPKPYKIREVSLVAFPQVKSARLFSENGYVSEYEEENTMPLNKDDKQTLTVEELSELKSNIRKEIEEEVKADFSDLIARLDKLENADVQLKETQVEHKVEKFQEDSKVVPAQADVLKKLLKSFSEEQVELFDEFMSNAQSIDLSEQGQVGDSKDPKDKTEELSEDEKFYIEHAKKFGNTI